ncbi:hypothetical protein K2W90_02665 [Candidatus Babeliales bacterium]|nr:hypothetical protein [Candidatus Babeliales bacterium]
MKSRARSFLLALFAFVSCVSVVVSAEQKSQMPSDAELRKKDDISHEFIAYVLTEGLTIIDLVENMDQGMQEKLKICCSGCKQNFLTCCELAGNLCSANDQKKLDELKEHLSKKNYQDIVSFMLACTQEKEIVCSLCQKFSQWELI